MMRSNTATVTHPHAGEIGQPARKWIIIPTVSPVPPKLPQEEAPSAEPERRAVPAEPVPA
jgi:hypothetical protein